MSRPFELVLPAPGRAVSVGPSPLSFGRGPGNDVVLLDDTISWHHAQVWIEGGAAWVRDLGSRNGTWRNGERVQGSTRLGHGDRIRLGSTYEVEVRGGSDRVSSPLAVRQVEDLSSGVRFAVRHDRFLIGSGSDCDLRVEDWPNRAATLMFHANGEVWLGTATSEIALGIDEIFEIQGHRLKVVEEMGMPAPTVDGGADRYPYVLRASANAPGGPQVTVASQHSGAECLVTGNRGVLLFVLARKLARDRALGATLAEEGWCTSTEVVTGVWGRDPKGAKRLNVLVHRLRGQLEEQGFDPWFVEKRRGGIRARCAHVELR